MEIVWIAGPYPAGTFPDFSIYREALKERLIFGERVTGDNGYEDPTKLLQSDAMELATYHHAIWAQHEALSGRLNLFNVLRVPFRHRPELHVLRF